MNYFNYFNNKILRGLFLALALSFGVSTHSLNAMESIGSSSVQEAFTVLNILVKRENIFYNLGRYRLMEFMYQETRKKYPYPVNDAGTAQITCQTLEEIAVYQQYKSYFLNEDDTNQIPGIILKLNLPKHPKIMNLAKFLHTTFELEQIIIQKRNALQVVVNNMVVLRVLLNKINTTYELYEKISHFLQHACRLIGNATFLTQPLKKLVDLEVIHPRNEDVKNFLDTYKDNSYYSNLYNTLITQYPKARNSSEGKLPNKLEATIKQEFTKPQTFEELITLYKDLLNENTKQPKKATPRTPTQQKKHKKPNKKSSPPKKIKPETEAVETEYVPKILPTEPLIFADPAMIADMLNTKFKVQDNSKVLSASDLVIEFGYQGSQEVTDRILCLQPDKLENNLIKRFIYHDRIQQKKRLFHEGLRDEDTVLHTFPECLERMKHQCVVSSYTDNQNHLIENWVFYGQKRIDQQFVTGLYVLGFLPGNGKRTCYHSFFVQKDLDEIKNNSATELLTPDEYQKLAEGLAALQQ